MSEEVKAIKPMSYRRVILALGLVAGCTSDPAPSSSAGAALGNAVRDAGFACEGAVTSETLGDAGSAWRVACADTQLYLASLAANGDVCIEPILFVDGLLPTSASSPAAQFNIPEARCVSGVTL